MEEQLGKAVETILQYIQQGTDFAITQAPQVAQEYLHYCAVRDIIGIVVASLVAIALITLTVWGFNKYEECGVIFGGIGAVIALVGDALIVLDLIKIHIAPRVYLLETLEGLLQ